MWCSTGTLLGLLLFYVYNNDFPKIINELFHTILHADDTGSLKSHIH